MNKLINWLLKPFGYIREKIKVIDRLELDAITFMPNNHCGLNGYVAECHYEYKIKKLKKNS